jgi:hypothetical protein
MCAFDPMSMAAAPTLTVFSSGRLPVVFFGMAIFQSMMSKGLGYANRHLPNRDRRQGDVTTLKFACSHGPCF